MRAESIVEVMRQPLTDERLAIVEKMLPALDDFKNHEGWLKYGCSEGFIKCSRVLVDCIPAFDVFYSVGHGPDASLFVNAIVKCGENFPFTAAILGVKMLARENNCTTIEAHTRREGMLESLKILGFVPIAVVLRLPVP